MAQPTVDGVTANNGSGGAEFWTDSFGGVEVPASLLMVSTGDGTGNIVQKEYPLPVGFNTAKDGSGTLLCPLVDADGHLQVDVLSAASHAVTNAGTFVVQEDGAALTALEVAVVDLAAMEVLLGTIDADTGAMKTALELIDTVGGGTEAAAMRVTIANDSTGVVSVDDNGGALTVDWAGTAPPIGAGTEAAALRVTLATDSTGLVSVDDNGGSLTVDAAGDVAHDAADSGNPLKIGVKAISTLPAVVATNDRANAVGDLFGRQLVAEAPLLQYVKGTTADLTDTTSTSVIAAGGASITLLITDVIVTNSDADTATVVKFQDGSGGTTVWRGYAKEAGGGFCKQFKTPLALTSNTGLFVACETTGATVQVSASGYKVPG